MAEYYFAGLLSSTFGKQIQNSLGIDQLAITPLFLKGASDPTARVTVGKQVSETVKIVFSQDIGTAQKQTYQVAWDASRRVRLIAERHRSGRRQSCSTRASSAGPIESRLSGRPLVASVESRPTTVRPFEAGQARNSRRGSVRAGAHLQGGDLIRGALVKGSSGALVRTRNRILAHRRRTGSSTGLHGDRTSRSISSSTAAESAACGRR
jgi:hypothetical protein